MVIQVSYIMLTQSQEHNSHSMKFNIVKNNIHQGLSWEKKKHLQAVKTETSSWLEVPRRVILQESSTPDNAGKSQGGDAELRYLTMSKVATHLL